MHILPGFRNPPSAALLIVVTALSYFSVSDAYGTSTSNFNHSERMARWNQFVFNQIDSDITSAIPFPTLGDLLDPPSIIQVQTEFRPSLSLLLTGNGANSESSQAWLYQFNVEDGTIYDSVHFPTIPHSLSGVVANRAIDIDEDGFADRVYLADLMGNIWRLDWNTEYERFEHYYANNQQPVPLFTASYTEPTGDDAIANQPIVSGIEVHRARNLADTFIVLFGTDEINQGMEHLGVHSFYGIIDQGAADPKQFHTLMKDDLVRQTLIQQLSISSPKRGLLAQRIDYTHHFGWYFDFPDIGEQVITPPTLAGSFVYVISSIRQPLTENQPQEYIHWLTVIDAETGDQTQGELDVDLDGLITENDSFIVGDELRPIVGYEIPTPTTVPLEIVDLDLGDHTLTLTDSAGNQHRTVGFPQSVRISWRIPQKKQ